MLQQFPGPPTPGCLLAAPFAWSCRLRSPIPSAPGLGFPRCSKASPPGARAGPEPGAHTQGAKAGRGVGAAPSPQGLRG